MEVERRNDSSKQGQLNDSIKRAMRVRIGHILPWERPANVERQSEEEVKDLGYEDFYNGERIRKCKDILKAVFRSTEKGMELDCTSIVTNQFWNEANEELVCDNVAAKLVAELASKNPTFRKISEQKDAIVSIDYSDELVECVAPLFPESDTISFKDVFTQCAPRLALYYIQKTILEFGGEATMDLQDCSIEAKLATHNFPAPVVIAVRIYFSEAYDSHVVRFDRISGDVLHFARVLKKLVSQCGYVLTGLSDEQYSAVEEKQKEASNDSDDFLNNFDIDSAAIAMDDANATLATAANEELNDVAPEVDVNAS